MGIGDYHIRRAVFLDRDGVIVEPVPDLSLGTSESPYRSADVRLVPGVLVAIRSLREAGFCLVGVSNQPAAAKGTVTLGQLRAVHDRTEGLLARGGAELDDWRYCFHHPSGIVSRLSIPCDCRKPAPGLLRSSAHDHGLDLRRSWMVGDSDSDVIAGQAAGARTILLNHPHTEHRRRGTVEPTLTAADLANAARLLLDDDRDPVDGQ